MDVQLPERFQTKLQQVLTAKGWSQSELAREMKVTRALVNQYVTGRRVPGLDMVCKFADALGIRPLQLLDDHPVQI